MSNTKRAAAPPTPEPLDADAVLAQATLPTRVVGLCLRGDLVSEHADNERRLTDVADWAATSIADADPRRELADRQAELEAEMKAAEVPFRIQAIAAKAWSDLLAQHPGKPGSDDQVDLDAFAPAAVAACLVSPRMTEKQVETLFERITAGQRDVLFAAVWQLNAREVTVPFSVTASAIRANSARK
jgi:hypothetical protein